MFKNLSYLLLPIRKIYYLAIPILFFLFYLNLSREEKKMLIFSVGFIFFSILPYQLFTGTMFYSYDYNIHRYFYIPGIGQAFLVASVLMILLSRLNSMGRLTIYACASFLLFSNLKAIGDFDKLFEEKEYRYKILVKGVDSYFKNNRDKIFVLFDFYSFLNPAFPSYFTTVLLPISGVFFDHKLISVSELKSLPNSEWIRDKYPILPHMTM